MNWLNDCAYFLGGAFLANGVPHFVSGVTGRSFQTPFAKPPITGLSSSTVNVLWGFLNFVIAYGLLTRVGLFNIRSIEDALVLGVGVLLSGLTLARLFGRYHGGNAPSKRSTHYGAPGQSR